MASWQKLRSPALKLLTKIFESVSISVSHLTFSADEAVPVMNSSLCSQPARPTPGMATQCTGSLGRTHSPPVISGAETQNMFGTS